MAFLLDWLLKGEMYMKRKFLLAILTIALTLVMIPTVSAFADTEGDGILGDIVQTLTGEDEGNPDVLGQEEGEEDADEDADEDVDEDADEDGDTEMELPKVNLKSPVTHWGAGDVGKTLALNARIGAEVVDPALLDWTSSDEKVAVVGEDGTITIVGEGKATITAVMKDGSAQSGFSKVFVTKHWPDKDAKEANESKAKENKGKKAGNHGHKNQNP